MRAVLDFVTVFISVFFFICFIFSVHHGMYSFVYGCLCMWMFFFSPFFCGLLKILCDVMTNRKQLNFEWNCLTSLTHDLDAWIKEPSPMLAVSKCIRCWSWCNMHYSNVLVIDNTNKLGIYNEITAEILLCTPRSTSKHAIIENNS